jgi:hypothetical protein
MILLADMTSLRSSSEFSSNADVAALQQQEFISLLDCRDLQSLLVLLLALYTRQLHKTHGGKPAAASLATVASSSSRQQRRQQQRQRQQQQLEEEQQQLLVPALHVQLLAQYSISEESLADSMLDAAIAKSQMPAHRYLLATVQALQLLLDYLPQQQCGAQQNSGSSSAGVGSGSSSGGGGSSSSSSDKVAWSTEMLTAVLQTIIEAQVRSMQQPANTAAFEKGWLCLKLYWFLCFIRTSIHQLGNRIELFFSFAVCCSSLPAQQSRKGGLLTCIGSCIPYALALIDFVIESSTSSGLLCGAAAAACQDYY